MPFVLICGYPSSGKTKRSEELASYLRDKLDKTVHIISDHTLNIDKNDIYAGTCSIRFRISSDSAKLAIFAYSFYCVGSAMSVVSDQFPTVNKRSFKCLEVHYSLIQDRISQQPHHSWSLNLEWQTRQGTKWNHFYLIS